MRIQLSDHFSYKKLFRFTTPSIIMMVFTSIYGVVDGLFVSNFVGKTSFAAVNFIIPFLMIIGAVGFMFGTGGSAVVAITMGEGDCKRANRQLSFLIYSAIIIGVVLTIVGLVFIRPIASMLGAEGELLENSVLYGRIILVSLTGFILQNTFQSFCVAAEKPTLGLFVIIVAGVTNMVLDALFVAVFQWGLLGAAYATGISQLVGGFVPFIYFIRPNESLLKLTKTNFDGKVLLKTCINGSSELMSNVSMSLVSMLYNIQLLKLAGENGVAAYGVLMYLNLTFVSIFLGYTIGIAPVISYHFGAGNYPELKNLLRKSLVVLAVFSVVMLALSEILASPLSKLFVGYSNELFELTLRGFRIFSFLFLFAGLSIFGSGFFTALNNGLVSALISFLRTLVFQVLAVLLLPIIFDIDGVWLSAVVAEVLSVVVTVIFIVAKRKKYHY